MTSSTQVTDVEEARKPPDWRTADLKSIFGAPTFLEGEDASQYQALADHFRQAVEPRDFLEAMWIDEITKYTFESQRYRRAKTHLWRSSAHRGLEAVLGPLLEEGIVAHGVAQGWAQGEPSLVEL